MKRYLLGVLSIGLIGLAPAFSNQSAKANFLNSMGETIGQSVLTQTNQGILIKSHITKLPEGWHGFHVHTIGNCVPPDFTSAGGHFNPHGKKHGYENPEGSHVGDLPNASVGPDGVLDSEVLLSGATLQELFDKDGSALVVHSVKDDYHSDPAGNAGGRIACGIIQQ